MLLKKIRKKDQSQKRKRNVRRAKREIKAKPQKQQTIKKWEWKH